ncbi:MAG: DUF411 domain-containing protein [Pseudorhodobacter sp.]|nr:DUF411 domain-containing protein [Pseudorhodobacter sp.]
MKRFAIAAFALLATPALAAEPVTIWRDPGCGCCDAYAEYLRVEGFDVTVIDDRNFDKTSISAGVPEKGLGCHLAKMGNYFVSGLVPVEILNRLMAEQPAITGITLPGMPMNAPGMAPEKTGTLKVYSFGPEGVAVYSDE